MRPTRLVADLQRLDDRIDAVLTAARANHNGLRRKLGLELLGVLNGTHRFTLIPQRIANTAGLTERIFRRVALDTNFALPRAVYEVNEYHTSPDSYINRGEVHRSEWTYLNRLARKLNVAPHHGYETLDDPPPWMIDVDEARQKLRVWIRELALQDMLLAGMEAYLVPAGSGRPSTEIYGIVFGSYRVTPPRAGGNGNGNGHAASQIDLNIERICIQHRAVGRPSEVTVDERSEATHLAMGEELFPYWHLLGDFHTHPYRTLAELYRRRGWQYSKSDEKMNVDWCQHVRSLGHRPRVAIILAISRAERRRARSEENWRGRPHVLRTTIGACHCFISAYRIRPDGRYSTDNIALKCPHLVGSRVHENGHNGRH